MNKYFPCVVMRACALSSVCAPDPLHPLQTLKTPTPPPRGLPCLLLLVELGNDECWQEAGKERGWGICSSDPPILFSVASGWLHPLPEITSLKPQTGLSPFSFP